MMIALRKCDSQTNLICLPRRLFASVLFGDVPFPCSYSVAKAYGCGTDDTTHLYQFVTSSLTQQGTAVNKKIAGEKIQISRKERQGFAQPANEVPLDRKTAVFRR